SHVFDKDPVTIATHSIFLHDALPISGGHLRIGWRCPSFRVLDRLAPGVSRGVRGTKSYPLPSSPSVVRLVDHLRQAVAVNFDAPLRQCSRNLVFNAGKTRIVNRSAVLVAQGCSPSAPPTLIDS